MPPPESPSAVRARSRRDVRVVAAAGAVVAVRGVAVAGVVAAAGAVVAARGVAVAGVVAAAGAVVAARGVAVAGVVPAGGAVVAARAVGVADRRVVAACIVVELLLGRELGARVVLAQVDRLDRLRVALVERSSCSRRRALRGPR